MPVPQCQCHWQCLTGGSGHCRARRCALRLLAAALAVRHQESRQCTNWQAGNVLESCSEPGLSFQVRLAALLLADDSVQSPGQQQLLRPLAGRRTLADRGPTFKVSKMYVARCSQGRRNDPRANIVHELKISAIHSIHKSEDFGVSL